MPQVIRPEDLESGVMFDVLALGTVPLGQTAATTDILSLQKPVRDLYLNYQKPTGVHTLPSCRLVVSNRGLAVTEVVQSQDRTPTAETLYNIPSVVFAAAVKFLIVGKKERDFRCAFEAIDSEGPPPNVAKGKNDLYVAVDKKWKHLTKVTSHPAICACVIQRMTGVIASELHAFVCESDLQARDVIFCLTSALKNFRSKESAVSSPAIYGHSPYDFQQQVRPTGPAEGVYGFQGHPDQMMGYRGGGADMLAKPGGMRPDGPGVGGQWDVRTQDGRPPPDGQQGSEWLSNQRDQLMRNFNNDQRKNEPSRNQVEQGIYDQQQRGVYDLNPSRGVYDSQPSKGVYDTAAAIYEYRPPQNNQGEPQRDAYSQGPPADAYTLRRDIYDPQMPGGRAQGDPGGNGNLYGPIRNMSGSSERVFQDIPKPNYDATVQRMGPGGGGDSYGGGPESEYSKGFALPRVKVSYDSETSSNARGGELVPPGGGEYGSRPLSVGYDAGRLQGRQSPLPQVKAAKVQPPAPLAKTTRPSATSPTATDAYPGLRPSGVAGGGYQDAAQQSVPVAARKVKGIKVFPTIMLSGRQAAAAAAAADEDGVNGEGGGGGGRQQPGRDLGRAPPQTEDDHLHGRRSHDEMESAFGGLSVDPAAKAGRAAANDFEQSLGYLP